MAKSSTLQKSTVEPFPVWKATNRALPNVVVRSSLFTARNPKVPRAMRRQEPLAVIGPGEIQYTGEELRQDDEDVLLYLVNEARKIYGNDNLANAAVNATFRVPFNRGTMVRELGWTRNTRSYKRLRSCMTRLKASELLVKTTISELESRGRAVSLITQYEWSGDEYWVELPVLFFRLYGRQYTSISWDQRQQLPAGLARWLHAYILSHKQPQPVKIVTIANGAGLKIPTTKNELAELRRAIRTASEALKAAGVIASGGVFSGDLFYYEKACVSVEQRDLALPFNL